MRTRVNGDLPRAVGSRGELTAVASAKRAARGDLSDGAVDSEDEVPGLVVIATMGSLLSLANIVM